MMLNLPSIMGTQGNGSSALAAPWGNYGDIENTGLEVALNTKPIETKDFSWNSDFQISFNKNKLKSLAGSTALPGYGQWTDVVSRSVPGESLYNFYGYEVEGIYQSFEDILNSPVNTLQQNNPIVENADGTLSWSNDPTMYNPKNTTYVGDIKYKDVNGDGKIDENDKTNIGSPLPDFTFGWNNTFTYKNWNLTAFITGVFGNDVYNGPRAHYNSAQMFSDGKNVLKEFLGFPAGDASGSLPSDRWIEKGTYIRLQSLSLSYTFRNCFNDWIKDLTLYGTANNLLTITNYKGLDPEVNLGGIDPGIDYRWSRYPHTRTFMVGVKINFGTAEKKAVVQDYSELNRLNGEIDKLRAENDQLRNREPEVKKEIVTKESTKYITYPYLVTFALGNTDITNQEKVNLEGIAKMIKNTPNTTFSVVGYADKQTGTEEINTRLAKGRAQNVYDLLTKEYGVPASRLTLDSKGGVDNMYLNDPRLSRSVIISEVK
jgi:outer membrane protein OmpA-like peptidoglycan-associated protein